MIYQPGEEIAGKYRVIDFVGGGAMGQVYKAEHKLMHKTVAIKILHQDVSGNSEIIQRFRREAQAAAAINHPSVCSVLDFDVTESGDFYLVMEYLEGDTLQQRIRTENRISARETVGILKQLLSVLQAAHDLGIVHRDVKPENIALIPREADLPLVKLLDFGIAHQDEKSKLAEDPAAGKTKLGFLYGTPEYIAPEQANGLFIDFRVDLYACGIILYEMLTGAPPFKSESIVVLLHMQVFDDVPHLPDTIEHASEFDAIIQKLLAKEPKNRFSSANAVIEALDSIQLEINDSEEPVSVHGFIRNKLYVLRSSNPEFDQFCREIEKRKILVLGLVSGIGAVLLIIILMIAFHGDIKEVEITEDGQIVASAPLHAVGNIQKYIYDPVFSISDDETLRRDPNILKAMEAFFQGDYLLCYTHIIAVEDHYKNHPNYMRLRMQAAYNLLISSKSSKSQKISADKISQLISDIAELFIRLAREVPDAARNQAVADAIGLAFFDSKLKIAHSNTARLFIEKSHKNLGNALFYAIIYGGFDAPDERKKRMMETFDAIPDFKASEFQKFALEAWRLSKEKCKDRESLIKQAFQSDISRTDVFFGLFVPLYQQSSTAKCSAGFRSHKNCNACMKNWIESGYEQWSALEKEDRLESAALPFINAAD